jgi:hypothetical protein
MPNPSVNRPARKLRLRVPSALRAPAAGYFQRCRARDNGAADAIRRPVKVLER